PPRPVRRQLQRRPPPNPRRRPGDHVRPSLTQTAPPHLPRPLLPRHSHSLVACLDSHLLAEKNKSPRIRHRAPNPAWLGSSACAGSLTMKSIVASASEFISALTNAIGASRSGPSARA